MDPARTRQAVVAYILLVAVALTALFAGAKARTLRDRAYERGRGHLAAGSADSASPGASAAKPLSPAAVPVRRLPPAKPPEPSPAVPPDDPARPSPPAEPVKPLPPADPVAPRPPDPPDPAPPKAAPTVAPVAPVDPESLPFTERMGLRAAELATLDPAFGREGAGGPVELYDRKHHADHADDNPPIVALFRTVDLEAKYKKRDGAEPAVGAGEGRDAPAEMPPDPVREGYAPATIRIHNASSEVLVLWGGECRVVPKSLVAASGGRYVIGARPEVEMEAQPLPLIGKFFVASCESPQTVFLLTTDTVYLYARESGQATPLPLDTNLIDLRTHRVEYAGAMLHFVGPRDYVRYDLRARRFLRAEYKSTIDHAGFRIVDVGAESDGTAARAFLASAMNGLFILEASGHVSATLEIDLFSEKVSLAARPIALIDQGAQRLHFALAGRPAERIPATLFTIGAPPMRRMEVIGNPVSGLYDYFAVLPAERGGLLALHDRGLSLLKMERAGPRWLTLPAAAAVSVALDRDAVWLLDANGAVERIPLFAFEQDPDERGDGSSHGH